MGLVAFVVLNMERAEAVGAGERLEHGCERSEQKCSRLRLLQYTLKQ